MILDEVCKAFTRTSRTCLILVWGGSAPHISVGSSDFSSDFLLVWVFCVRDFDFLGYLEPCFFIVGCLLSIICLLFISCRFGRPAWCDRAWNTLCDYITGPHRHWRAEIACPLIHHYYSFAGNPEPTRQIFFFNLLAASACALRLYHVLWLMLRVVRLYAMAIFDVYCGPRRTGSAYASSSTNCFRLWCFLHAAIFRSACKSNLSCYVQLW